MMTREAIRAARERLASHLRSDDHQWLCGPETNPDCASFAEALDTAEAYHDLVERVEHGLAEHRGRGRTCDCSRCNLLRTLLPGAKP